MMLHAQSHAMRRAFTLLELLCTVAIIAILLALLLPVLERGLGRARRAACSSNLQNIGIAFSAWAHDHNDLFPMQISITNGGTREFAEAAALNPNVSFTFRHFQVLSNDLAVAKVLRCPADKQRVAGEDFASLGNTNVSYWINVGAAFGRSDSPIAGDRNVRTSGRTEWTFVQFGTGDAIEFSAELHGYRGNVLLGDGHVSLFDGAALSTAFASASGANSNSGDTTLSLPRQDVDESSSVTSSASSSTSANDQSSGNSTTALSTTNSSGGGGSGSDNAGAATRKPSTSNAPAPPTAFPGAHSAGTVRRRSGIDEIPVLITLLDGTVITSSLPREVTNAAASNGAAEGGIVFSGNPLLELAEWLTRHAARYTYWLLLLLLAALIAFELARRRARRKRRGGMEE
jgi:prepilin-type N-terminal cleavage/methylation domain-containing protein/prepilin-type processing-associated H-X9-DG protein